ncbi:hypothetical protein EIP86_007843 [Pleurotus ostreatoroseus]|nr:hypothetical protein EIP86_007843 [Pleurotus ostreatoroseus]
MHKLTAAVVLSAITGQVFAICPGFNFAIGNQQDLGGGVSRWNVYDDSCNVVDGLTTTGNPCDSGIFGCSPPPIIFDQYTSSFNGLIAATTEIESFWP